MAMKREFALESAYRRAFHDFSAKVRQVQDLVAYPHPDPAQVETALIELQKAHLVYDKSRDAWVQELFRSPSITRGPIPVPDSAETHIADIRAIAELLWESAGRPEGTAEEDWRRAEDIIRRAAAAA